MKTTCLFLLGLAFCWGLSSCTAQQPKPEEVIEIINRVNNYWQETHPQHGRSFWDNAAYHTGNMEVFFLTGKDRKSTRLNSSHPSSSRMPSSA